MATHPRWRAIAMIACIVPALACGALHAQEIPLVTGEHWSRSTESVKKAYLVGIANAFQVEAAFEAPNPPSDGQSIVPRVVRGMRGQTLDGVRAFLDAYYEKNPDKLQRPVIETIWFEIVVPGLKKAG